MSYRDYNLKRKQVFWDQRVLRERLVHLEAQIKQSRAEQRAARALASAGAQALREARQGRVSSATCNLLEAAICDFRDGR